MFSHVIITGRPGSGKSRGCVRPLLRELVGLNSHREEMKAGMLCLDGKGGELRGYLEEALQRAGRSQDLIVVGPKDATFNFLGDNSCADVKIANQLIAAASFLGEEVTGKRTSDPFWDHCQRDVLTALVAVGRKTHALLKNGQPFSLDHLVRLRPILTESDKAMAKTAADLAVLVGPDAGASLIEFAALPTNTRQCVATSVGAVLAAFGRPPLRDVLNPQPGRPEVSLIDVVDQGKIVLLDLAGAENALELLPAAVMIKTHFARLIISRRTMPINQCRPVFVLLEEFQKLMTPQADSAACEGNWMDTCRWCGCGVIICTQGISSLLAIAPSPLVDKIISLCGTQMWLGSGDPASASYAARSLGRNLIYRTHRAITHSLPPPLLFPRAAESPQPTESRMLVPDYEPVLSAEKLALLPPGEIHLRLRSGKVKTVRVNLAAD